MIKKKIRVGSLYQAIDEIKFYRFVSEDLYAGYGYTIKYLEEKELILVLGQDEQSITVMRMLNFSKGDIFTNFNLLKKV
jgi:hypothetical protein